MVVGSKLPDGRLGQDPALYPNLDWTLWRFDQGIRYPPKQVHRRIARLDLPAGLRPIHALEGMLKVILQHRRQSEQVVIADAPQSAIMHGTGSVGRGTEGCRPSSSGKGSLQEAEPGSIEEATVPPSGLLPLTQVAYCQSQEGELVNDPSRFGGLSWHGTLHAPWGAVVAKVNYLKYLEYGKKGVRRSMALIFLPLFLALGETRTFAERPQFVLDSLELKVRTGLWEYKGSGWPYLTIGLTDNHHDRLLTLVTGCLANIPHLTNICGAWFYPRSWMVVPFTKIVRPPSLCPSPRKHVPQPYYPTLEPALALPGITGWTSCLGHDGGGLVFRVETNKNPTCFKRVYPPTFTIDPSPYRGFDQEAILATIRLPSLACHYSCPTKSSRLSMRCKPMKPAPEVC